MVRELSPRTHAMMWLGLVLLAGTTAAEDVPIEKTLPKPPPSAVLDSAAGLEPIGGRWYLRKGSPNLYIYKDGDLYVDLFSYHQADSNEDGIPNLAIRHDATSLVINSQGYPNHPTAIFPNSRNPNRIRVQDFHFRLPLVPKKAEQITRVPMGEIGMALNGVVFFNPFEAGGMNAIEGYSEVWLDSCCGHPQQFGVYHYHKYPSCVKSPFTDDGQRHSPVLGFAFDGFPLYGPYEEAGVMARDLKGDRALDVCNGHDDPKRGYHYHVTPNRFPYILGGYAGVPELSNNFMLRRAGKGAIVDNTDRSATKPFGLVSVTPGNAARGKLHTLRFELDPSVRGGIPAGVPSWVQIGPFEAKKISRKGNVVTAEVDVPADAPLGVMLDAHIEFGKAEGGLVRVLKKNDAFRVVP
ncbi:MAG: YHYH protein [Isosphaeraceae bacterium]